MAVSLLIVQPGADDPIGPLGDWLTAAGAELTVCRPYEQPVPTDLDGYQGLVVLGGQMGALDDVRYPWLADVRKLLAGAVSNRVPTLAICLGAQLLAAATGGRVRVMDKPEVGARLVAKRDIAGQDPLWAELPLSPDVIQFHSDEVGTLPASAKLLASAPACENQAFRIGANCYALQFHIETTPEVVLGWAENSPDKAAVAQAHFSMERMTTAHEDIAETWQPFARRFVQLAAGELGAAPGVPLPLV